MGWVILVLMLVAAAGIGLALWSGSVARKVEGLVPKTGRTTKVTGGEIHWIERGHGRPVVMIHGLGGQLHHFTYAVMELLKDEFRCIALDRPGCGYSEREGDHLAALPEQARMIAEFLETEGIEKPLIVGHSLGGALALTLALNHPDRVGGLALIAPLTHEIPEPPAAFKALAVRSPFARRLIGHTLAVPMGMRTAKRTLAMVFAPEPAPADFVTRGGGALGMRPRAFVTSSSDFVASAGIAEQARRYDGLTVPGGVLYGDRDAILDFRAHGEALTTRLPHLKWEVLEGRGHMLPITAPEETAAFIRRMEAEIGA